MTEPSTRLMRTILRILTPEEIGVLTDANQSQQRIPLTNILNAYLRGEKVNGKTIQVQKKKREDINVQSKRQEVIELYRETSKAHVAKNDSSKSDLSGVLIKKRV